MIVDHAHDLFDTAVERTGRAIRLQFVVLDEVDAGAAQLIDKVGRLLRTQTDARLDDRPDQRPSFDTGKLSRSGNAEARPRIRITEFRRQADVEQAQAGHRLQFEQIARDRSEQVRQRRSQRIERP